jgi:hypothetical protein
MEVTTARTIAQLLLQHRIPQLFDRTKTLLPMLVDTLIGLDDQGSWQDILRRLGLSTSPTSVRKGKQRCVDLLHRALSMIDVEHLQASTRVRARIRAHRQFDSALIMSACTANNSMMDILDTTKELTARFDLTLPWLMVEQWRIRYLSINNSASFEACEKQIDRLERVLMLESEMNRLTQAFTLRLHDFQKHYESALTEMQELLARAEHIHASIDTFYTRITIWQMRTRYGHVAGDPDLVIRTCQEALQWLVEHSDYHSEYIAIEFKSNLNSALTQIGGDNGDSGDWEKIIAKTNPSLSSSHDYLQTYCTCLLISRAYEKAAHVVRECLDVCPADVAEWRKQLWKLLHTYIAEIVTVEAIATSPYWESVRASSIVGQVAPDMKFMVKNKVVFNAALVIIDIVQAVRSAKYDYVIDRAPELQKYATRYGSTKRTPRTVRFMRMLSALVAADFDPVEADRRASAIRAKYADADSVVRDDAELIPYDDLWKVVLHHLNRARQTK